jgi:hypothetical protein
LERNVDAVRPRPPKVETRRKPTEEQLAQVLEIMLSVEPEKSEPVVTFKFPECFTIYKFILITIPIRSAVIVERINPTNASSGR